MPAKYPCGICSNPVANNHKAVWCDLCCFWVHIKCNQTTPRDYELLKESDNNWCCKKCYDNLTPFITCDDESLRLVLQGKDPSDLETEIQDPQIVKIAKDIDGLTVNEDMPSSCAYYTISELNETKPSPEATKFFHLNTASLGYHFETVQAILSNCDMNFDFIGITETRVLKDVKPTSNTDIEKYEFVDCPTEASKGGVRIYISKKYRYTKREDIKIYKSKLLESVFVEVTPNKGKRIVVGCIYRHPSMSITEFNEDYITPLLEKLSNENKDLVLMGDYNIDLLKYDTIDSVTEFLNIMQSNSLIPLILKPTRITTKSKTLIDNIFTNVINIPHMAGNLAYSVSDHLPQFAILDTGYKQHKSIQNTLKRSFKNFERNDFLADFSCIDWDLTFQNFPNDPNRQTEMFLSTVNNLLDKHAPYVKSKDRVYNPYKNWLYFRYIFFISYNLFGIYLKYMLDISKEYLLIYLKYILIPEEFFYTFVCLT